MKKPIALLLIGLLSLTINTLWAQESTKTPKFIQRNEHFKSQRKTGTEVRDLASDYYRATEQKALMTARTAFKRKTDQWTPIGPQSGTEDMMGVGRINSITFHPSDSNIFFVCVGHGGVWKTSNNGKSWVSISANLPVSRTSTLAIHPSKPETMYVALGDMAYAATNFIKEGEHYPSHYGLGIYKSTDGGLSWNTTGLSHKFTDYRSTLYCDIIIHPQNPETILALGMDGCFKSTDGGVKWTQTHSDILWDAKVAVNEDNTIYASTGYLKHLDIGGAGIIKSEDFGSTWTTAKTTFSPKAAQRIELAICQSDPNRIYALTCNTNHPNPGFFGLFVSNDAGKSFDAIIGGNYKYNLLGTGFTFHRIAIGQGTYDLALWVDSKNEDEVYVGGINLWKSSNGGKDFLPVSNWEYSGSFYPLHGDVHQIQQSPLNNRYFVCHDGGVSSTMSIKSTSTENADIGLLPTKWTHYLEGLNIKSYYRLGIKPNEPERVMAGAQDNGTDINYTDGWAFLSGGDGQECVFDGDGHAYTSIQNGMVQQWLDFGDGRYRVAAQQNVPDGEKGAWTTPFLQHDGTLYIAYGNVYKHLTFGQGEAISDFPNAKGRDYPLPTSALYMSPLNAQKIYLAKRGYPEDTLPSEIWHSPDEGKSWVDISEGLPTHLFPTYLIGRENAPKNVWITFGGFSEGEKVYASTDFGETWKNISYNLPNVPVNSVAYQNDKSRNVYVATDIGVFYLDAATENWVPYSEGLPNVIVTELEASPEDGMLKASTFGRGLWEVKLLPITGLNTPQSLEFSLYPNPGTTHTSVQFGALSTGILRVRNSTGQLVHTVTLENASQYQLDSKTWLSGTYFISFSNAEYRFTRQFLKVD